MSIIEFGEAEEAIVANLISKLDGHCVVSLNEISSLHKSFVKNYISNLLDGPKATLKLPSEPIYNQPQNAFFSQLRKSKDNIFDQIALVERFYERFWTLGESVPPYFIMRIAIILRKAKRVNLEYLFLTSWERHNSIYKYKGSTESLIEERLAKIRAKNSMIIGT